MVQTAFHLAVENGRIKIAKLLSEHGADVNIKDSNRYKNQNNKFVKLISICNFILFELNITTQFVDLGNCT
jgi:ankyrin repeat protein